MIAFGCSITAPDVYASCAEPGLLRVLENDSLVIANAAAGSIFRSYNLILDQVAELADLEALVLVHQDAEIADPDFLAKARAALRDPQVAVVGCVGAVGVRSIAWWEGSVTWASFAHRYRESGGGEVEAFTWGRDGHPPYARTGEVDTVDGFTLVLSPWAVANVRFDESLPTQIHGYDFDYCLQVRAAGRKVVTADFKMIHHHSLELVSDPEIWIRAHMAVAEKWDGRLPGVAAPNWGASPEDWRTRARRAEAEAGAARLERVSTEMKSAALERQLRAEIELMRSSIGWRLTEPLRRANKLRHDARALRGRLAGRSASRG
jgi:hypothetical protein